MDKREIVDRFWQRMGKLIGIIPWRVISIMDLLELSGSDALAEVKDWGTAINATIQAEGQAIYDEGIERKTVTVSKFDIFGRHATSLDKFELTAGEKSTIQRIAKSVQENGILRFIHGNEANHEAGQEHIPEVDDIVAPIVTPAEIQKSLIKRLATYYGTRPGTGIKMDDFNNLAVRITEQAPNRVAVKADCVLKCGRSVVCIQTGRTWAVSNYVQHITRVHQVRKSDCIAHHTRSRRNRSNRNRRNTRVDDFTAAFRNYAESDGSDESYAPEEANSISSTGSYTTVEEHELENLDKTHDRDEDDDDQDDDDQDDADQADADQADDDQDNDDDQNIEGEAAKDTEASSEQTVRSPETTVQPVVTAQPDGPKGRKRGPKVASIIEQFSPQPECSYRSRQSSGN